MQPDKIDSSQSVELAEIIDLFTDAVKEENTVCPWGIYNSIKGLNKEDGAYKGHVEYSAAVKMDGKFVSKDVFNEVLPTKVVLDGPHSGAIMLEISYGFDVEGEYVDLLECLPKAYGLKVLKKPEVSTDSYGIFRNADGVFFAILTSSGNSLGGCHLLMSHEAESVKTYLENFDIATSIP